MLARLVLGLLLGSPVVLSQYSISAVDSRNARYTIPAKLGTFAQLPATCRVGEVYFASNATAGRNLYFCSATNTWTQVAASAGGGGEVGGSASFAGTSGVVYDASAGVAGVDVGFLRTGAGKYTLRDPTADTGVTGLTLTPGAGQGAAQLLQSGPLLTDFAAGVQSEWDGYVGRNNFFAINNGNVFGGMFLSQETGTSDASSLSAVAYTLGTGSAYAIEGFGYALSSGTVPEVIGVSGQGLNQGSGTVTSIEALSAWSAANSGGGTVTNTYGLRVYDQTVGVTNYAIHTKQTAGATNWAYYGAGAARSYFGGQLIVTNNGASTDDSMMSVAKTSTRTASGVSFGQDTWLAINPGDVTSAGYVAAYGGIGSVSANARNLASVVAKQAEVYMEGSGTTTAATGLDVTISNANAGGTITNAYGVYVRSMDRTGPITNSWGVYVADTVAKNYFGGSLGIGENTKLSTLTVKPPADASNVGGTTTANASTTITGSGTAFLSQYGIGDRISLSSAAGTYATITAIASDTSMTVSAALGDGSSQTINRKSSIFRLDDASGAAKVVVADNGNIGFGTLAPSEQVEVEADSPSLAVTSDVNVGKYGYGAFALKLHNPSAATPKKTFFSFYTQGYYADAGTSSGHEFSFYHDFTDTINIKVNHNNDLALGGTGISSASGAITGGAMTILSGGNVLIGTDSNDGSNKLQVNGGIRAVLPTSCSGKPEGTLWNDSATVKVCPAP
jgi:hypothetical protein